MELNSLMQALAKDLAEQMRPMVADMVRQELIRQELAAVGTASDINLTDLVQHLTADQLEVMARNVNLADLSGEFTESQLTELAGEINLADLANEIDLEKLSENIDLDETFKEFFQDNSFSIRP
jgi:hypothetical protein